MFILTIQEFKQIAKNKKIAVIGIGVSNIPLIRMLAEFGAEVYAFDRRNKEQLEETYDELLSLGVKMILGEDYLDKIDNDTYMLFKTPGLRFDVPQLLKAKENGTIISSEMELFLSVALPKSLQ